METYTLRPRSDPRPAPQYRIDYEGELNPAQLEAATTLEGPILVIAGAGSGKTRTLVYRVARLVESGINPGHILLLTFTRKSAEEMLRRASALVGASCERVAGGTFHSFANTVLRRAGRRLGLEPGFTILDRGDSEDLVSLGEQYAQYKREKSLVDYDDLLVLLRDLVRDHPEVAQQLSRTYRFIMVDESQHTNRLQAEIVRGL